MKNPFGTQIRLEAADAKKSERKDVDVVKLHLQCIPSLENAKKDLEGVSDAIANGDLKTMVVGFIDEIEKMEEKILAITMRGIRDARQSRQEEISTETAVLETPQPAPIAAPEVSQSK